MEPSKRSRSGYPPQDDPFGFLPAHGEMAQRIRELEWAKTLLGGVEYWPESLRTALAICLKSGFTTYVWWGPALVQFYNDVCIRPLGTKHPAALGKPAKESWHEVWAEIEPLIERAWQGEPVFVQDFEVVPDRDNTFDSAFFTFSMTPLTEEGGEIAGMFITALETTDKVRAEIAAHLSEQRLLAIVESATEYAIITLDSGGLINSWNSGAQRLLGYREEEVLGQSGAIFFTPEDQAAGAPDIEMIQTRESGRSANERWHMRKDGSLFWGSGVMLPLEGDKRDRYLKIFQDKSELHKLRERQRMLDQQLARRGENTLAIVQSIVMQTLRRSGCSEESREALESRLVALSRAQDALAAGDWHRGDLRYVAESMLRLVLHESFDARAHLHGPDIHLNSGALLGLSLALHELVTNAVKYGALSNDVGHVEIGWEVVQRELSEFRLRWIERGGPPVKHPEQRGYGSRVIEEGLAREIDGKVEIKYANEGLECTVQAPLQKVTGEP